MSDPFRNASELKGYWISLYGRLTSMATCEGCDQATKEREALAVLNAIREAMDTLDPISGCIHTAQHVALHLAGVRGARTDSGEVDGAGWFGLFGATTTRTWFQISTHCFEIVLVAWWKRRWWALASLLSIRHQAVMITSHCKPDYASPDNPVIDLALFSRGILFAKPIWLSYGDWVGDKDDIGKSSGLVRDGF